MLVIQQVGCHYETPLFVDCKNIFFLIFGRFLGRYNEKSKIYVKEM